MFGSEYVSMKQSCEHIQGLAFNLRMMGISDEGSSWTHGDNQSVLANYTVPESVLKKKSLSLTCHPIR